MPPCQAFDSLFAAVFYLYRSHYRLNCFVFCLFLFVECFTPNDANGFCVNIMGCPELRTLLETQRKNSTTVSFLRKSLCGFEGRDPKVCCPSANSPSSTSDDAQTVETTTTRLGGSRRPNRPNKEPSFSNNNNNNNNENDKDDYYETISSKKLPSQNTCGRTNTSHIRIVGGNPADLGIWSLGGVPLSFPNPFKVFNDKTF